MKKRPLVVLSCLAFAVLALSTQHDSMAAPGSALPPTRPTATIPPPKLDVPPSIAGFAFLGGATSKANPPLKSFALEVPVRVSGSSPRSGKLLVKQDGSTILNAPFTIAAGETKAIPVVSQGNTEKTCHPSNFELEIEGSGFDVKKTATLSSACTYTSENVNPWNLATPDLVEARQTSHVYFNDVSVSYLAVGASNTSGHIFQSGVTACAANVVFKTTVKNNLNHAVSGMAVRITLNGVVKGTSLPFSLAAGQSSQQTALFKFAGEAGTYYAELVDPANTAQGLVSSSGYHVDIAHTCTVTTALNP